MRRATFCYIDVMFTFDHALGVVLLIFAVLGAVAGARVQMKFLFGLYFAVALTPVGMSAALPRVAAFGGFNPQSLYLKTILFSAFVIVLFFAGIKAFELSPINPYVRGQEPSALDRIAGLFVGAGKTTAFLYVGLCGALLLEKSLPAAATLVKAGEGSVAFAVCRDYPLFTRASLPPDLERMLAAGRDPVAARERLQAEMKAFLAEVTATPEPSAKNKALAEAIKKGDIGAMSQDERFGPLVKSAGMQALLKPGAGFDAALKAQQQ